MADLLSYANPDRDIEQAIVTLKKGTPLIKYSRKGKPKFCPFKLSADETTLIWYSHGAERKLKLSTVQRVISGQRTPVFKRYLRPEKEYLSFSLLYNNGERSLDLICKDTAEAEVWIAGLKALISTGQNRARRTRSDISDLQLGGSDSILNGGLFFGLNLEPAASVCRGRISFDLNSSCSDASYESANMQPRTAGGGGDASRVSVSSTPSCSSIGSGQDEGEAQALCDIYVWGKVWCGGLSNDGYGGNQIHGETDVLTPKPLESNVVLDVNQIACGTRHVVLVTRQGEVFSWGEEAGGRLGHGIEKDLSRPRVVEYLSNTNIEFVACGEFHTAAISTHGDLYTWGDGIYSAGLLGHGNDVSHWMPKRLSGPLHGLQVVSVACGRWHSALATSNGKLFTFGDGSFGVLGHGNRESFAYPKEVEILSTLRTIKVACGVWHTAAIVELPYSSVGNNPPRKLYTWGDGDKYKLGHGNKETYLNPTPVAGLIDYDTHMIACGHYNTVALTTTGHLFTMGSNSFGQLGTPQSDGKSPCLVQDTLVGVYLTSVSCGAFHVAVLSAGNEVYTWGKGANGRLGHGDSEDCYVPTMVEALKDKLPKTIACGSNYTASICPHKGISGADQYYCTGCKVPFSFTRKRHTCYNCGLVHCHNCSSKKAPKSTLAHTGKPHRVCDNCYVKLKKALENRNSSALSRKGTTVSHIPSDGGSTRGETRISRDLFSPTLEPVKKYFDVRSVKSAAQPENLAIVRASSQVQSFLQLKDIHLQGLSAIQSALKPVMTGFPQTQSQSQPQHSLPPSQPNSRPVSPYSQRPSPPRSITPVFSRGVIDNLKKNNELKSQEVKTLKEELKKTEKKVTEMNATVSRMKDKLKEVREKFHLEMSVLEALNSVDAEFESSSHSTEPQEIEDNSYIPSEEDVVPPPNQNKKTKNSDIPPSEDVAVPPNENKQITNETTSSSVSESTTTTERQNSTTTTTETVDAVISEDRVPEEYYVSSTSHTRGSSLSTDLPVRCFIQKPELGVYLTLVQLENGTTFCTRVKFSRKLFTPEEGERWCKERLDESIVQLNHQHKLNCRSAESSSIITTTVTTTSTAAIAAAPPEENNNNNNDDDNHETATATAALPENKNEAAEGS